MSIATAITNLQSRVADAYTSVGNKGGTLPQVQDTLHLPAAIASIPAGSSSKFGATIEDVFKTVTANDETTLTMWGGATSLTFTGVTNIPDYGMQYKFANSSITSVSFPALTSAGNSAFDHAFSECTSLTSVSFPELTSDNALGNMFQYAFDGCTSLTSVSFPKLATITRAMFSHGFEGCTSLTTVSFPELTTISASSTNYPFQAAFTGCTNLTSVSFPKLASISGTSIFSSAFGQGTSSSPLSGVTSLSFPALTAIISNAPPAGAMFNSNKTLTRIDFPVLTSIKKTASATTDNLTYLFSNCTNLTEIHFGSANQSVIEASDGYATKWGAPNANCTIYFDL